MKAKHHSAHKKAEPESDLKPPKIADLFVDEAESVVSSEGTPLKIEVENAEIEIDKATIAPAAEATEELPSPSFPMKTEVVSEDDHNIVAPAWEKPSEPSLPKFFAAEREHQEEKPVMPTMAEQKAEAVFKAAVPQAFVGEIDEASEEVKSERRGVIVAILVIIGILLLAGGALAFYLKTVGKLSLPSSTPLPTVQATTTPVVTPTPVPTPTASSSADLTDLKKKAVVSVLNGTTVKGLAAKEAAVLKNAGYKTGTVGNGDPKAAGTITYPSGFESLVDDIKSLLSNFTFTATTSAVSKKDVVVTLPQPNQ